MPIMKEVPRPIEILLVEDSETDIRLTQIALDQANFTNSVNVVRDGESAVAYLKAEREYRDRPTPDLVLLDLNLPKLNGDQVLKEIRSMEEFKSLPIVVLTTSDADQDIYKSYELQANCYITKPVDLRKFMGVVQMIEGFWLRAVSFSQSEKKF